MDEIEEHIKQYLEKRNLVHFEVSVLPLDPTEKVLINYNGKTENITHLVTYEKVLRFLLLGNEKAIIAKDKLILARNILINIFQKMTGIGEIDFGHHVAWIELNASDWMFLNAKSIALSDIVISGAKNLHICNQDPNKDGLNVTFLDILNDEKTYQSYLAYWS
jgi:hypothetical protein